MDFYIHKFPEELHARLNRKAAGEGKTLKAHVISILQGSLNLKQDGLVDDEMVVTCPACGLNGPLVRFGDNARCFHCGIGFLVPEGA